MARPRRRSGSSVALLAAALIMPAAAQEEWPAITSTHYNSRGMHEQTDRLLDEFIVPALSAQRDPNRSP